MSRLDQLRVGLAQLTSSDRYSDNITCLERSAAAAESTGCDLLALPEVAGIMPAQKFDLSEITDGDDPFVNAARECATRRGIWIHIGSTLVRSGDRLRNHSLLIDRNGRIHARYDKLHLFDVHLEGGKPFRESDRYQPGSEAVAVHTPWGLCGMSICYDLRFPQLYRDYGQIGARVIFVPSAFTVPTGNAHWQPLLQTRAIENGCWIVAAAQVGIHPAGRRTYGHSMIVSPWGRVVVDLGGDGTGFAATTLDLGLVQSARRQLASLSHDRDYRMRIEDTERHT
ncbi:MAG: carbon-nitrogen hydrolase family protein [Rhodobacteraceae bacterium]|nr:carbon-nitrogen hydrolase family protein [Paracoccaceae bacterium]